VFFRQVLHSDLGCASYIVADAGVAAVIDPKWEIEDYLELAEEQGFQVAYILETHNHADHVSGRGRLALATSATIYVSPTPGSTIHTKCSPTATQSSSEQFGSRRWPPLDTGPSTRRS